MEHKNYSTDYWELSSPLELPEGKTATHLYVSNSGAVFLGPVKGRKRNAVVYVCSKEEAYKKIGTRE